jgi:hypothetical protein
MFQFRFYFLQDALMMATTQSGGQAYFSKKFGQVDVTLHNLPGQSMAKVLNRSNYGNFLLTSFFLKI